ncbi:MAG: PAS domain S-box protein, partial [Candidatus Marinimicrobia bacterium]|nr:PAS domain S-box protein [Candidatus Neomarinimicrobiota bacterium]
KNIVLRHNREKLRMTLNSIGDAVISTDLNGNILRMNPVAEELTGWQLKDVKGKPLNRVFDIINAKTREKVENPVRKVLEEGKTIGLANHTMLIARDGKEYQIADSGAPIKDAEGNINGAVLVFRDVTEEYRMRESLKASRRKYKTVFENTGTATCIIQQDGTITLANKEFLELAGSQDIAKKKKLSDFIDSENFKTIKEEQYASLHSNHVRSEDSLQNHEYDFIALNGKRRNVFLTIDNIPGSKKFVASLLDITPRKQMEIELRENMERYRSFFKTSRDCVFITSKDGRWIDMNEAAVELFDYNSKAELKKVRIPELYANPVDRKAFLQKLENEGYVEDQPLDLKKKNGEIIHTLITSVPIRDESGEVTRLQGSIKDITERREREKEREKLQKQLTQAQKLKSIGTLAGGVAHDFNNILTVIIGLTQIIMSQMDESDPNYEHLESIFESAERAAKLTEQLLLFSRKKGLELEALNLNETISHLEKMLNRLIGEDITMYDSLTDDLWQIKADEGQIEQVITNLVVNARDAMPQGGELTISTQNVFITAEKAKTIPDIKPGEYVRLTVEDTGTGMEQSIQDKIFEPFFTTKGRAEGTGMGLSVVHGIIKKHNGLINVYSEPGEGTIFRIYLPAILEKNKEQSENKAEADIASYRGSGETVLLVEDEKPVLTYLEDILERYKYNFLSAKNGEKALEIFEDNKPAIDLLISDVIMTGINGVELADKLKQQKPDLKVILSSGYSDRKVVPHEIKKKGYRFIQKPYNIKKLLELVREALNKE